MNKQDLIAKVAELTGITKKDAGEIVSATFVALAQALADGKEVSIAKFGKFGVKEIEETVGRNPSTGEPLTIPAHKRPTFKYSSVVKEAVR